MLSFCFFLSSFIRVLLLSQRTISLAHKKEKKRKVLVYYWVFWFVIFENVGWLGKKKKKEKNDWVWDTLFCRIMQYVQVLLQSIKWIKSVVTSKHKQEKLYRICESVLVIPTKGKQIEKGRVFLKLIANRIMRFSRAFVSNVLNFFVAKF